ncbi:hypothetical protein EW145_g5684 [Phellinidium pouzarii]|uniref:Major facilitator superfamily (MFS) profile domain-containing protein n=1 Tax=Phellinidium pouzarii TaxID=167371 RepID=A0A4S4KZR5_9AGAM|nr:hypothetical protein EW145_g5684 [Phellinidium pouzarii]
MARSSSSLSEKNLSDEEKYQHTTADTREVDEAAQLYSQSALDPAEALRVRRKIDKHILPLMCGKYTSLFKFLRAAILGIKATNHLDATQYNWLGTIFYLSYLVFEYPQNLALQRLPVGKWMSLNIFIWGAALCAHAACHNFGGLLTARIVLGMCEGAITAGFMIVSSMFYTRREQTVRVGYWSQIVTGFISFGALHIKTDSFEPWQWLMIITGGITLITAVCYWFLFPDSPTNAWFLTYEERAIAINRIKDNQTGVENKHFKKEQMIETLKDPKTWVFALFSCIDNIPNSLTNQMSIIVASFGFSVLQTTLLGCVSGLVEIVTIFTGVHLAAYYKNSIAYVGTIYFIPNILGSILVNVLPWSDKVGLLFSVWITGVGTTGFVLSLAWVNQTTAGHTKRVTMNAIMLIAYCVGNALGPQMWLQKYSPRNLVPWVVITICYVICPMLLMLLRYILNAENKRRDKEPLDDTYDDVWVKVTDENGKLVEKKVDKAFLDLTDRQNRAFRYVL